MYGCRVYQQLLSPIICHSQRMFTGRSFLQSLYGSVVYHGLFQGVFSIYVNSILAGIGFETKFKSQYTFWKTIPI